ncbi:MAG TPA: peptidoglycan DD-metalloendopeptidase family protein [Steroidobacteraceae bacterium]|nr:peptidoglycan DD-metalloendopeptidase family protein [Steroidobacteraceae bacterium]
MQEPPKINFDYKLRRTKTGAAAHVRWFSVGILLPVIGGIVGYVLTRQPQPQNEPVNVPAIELPQLPDLKTIGQLQSPSPIPKPLGDTVEFVVRRNDTLDRIFRQLKLDLSDLASIRDLPGVQKSLDQLRPGDTITLVHEEGLLQALSRRISDTELLSVTRSDDGFKAKVVETPLDLRIARAHGTIESSLFVAARAAGISPDIILRLANDIFGWDIDFALDIQPGDRFSVVYEQKYRGSEYIGDGKILAAEFINNGEAHRAVLFESADGKVSDYFAPDGHSMRRAFLRAPLDFTRISSNFDPHRFHPILNIIRAHKGVDYAAPRGTVIKAAGDGRVDFIGRKGGYGNVVILEHGGGISTLYGHMSRFAAGLKQGQRVKQGVTIGYVGSSGAATGPHLHYEYRVNGVHKNPRTVPLPVASPIAAQYAEEFQRKSGEVLAQLDKEHDQATLAVSAHN